MRVLLLGAGGRESAMAWALARSSSVQLWVAPGNPGIAEHAELLDVSPTDAPGVVAAAATIAADLVVVGPEAPLVVGVGDALRAEGRRVFGPGRGAAMIEGSKAFAKRLMDRAGVPTARWHAFESVQPALAYLEELGPPYVIKADGLAAGKGVVVTEDRDEAQAALEERLVQGLFGDAGRRVVIEEYLDGPEASLIVFSDGTEVAPCEVAQDYKRIGDGDTGPNTGGMGSYSPVPECAADVAERIVERICKPMVGAAADMGTPFVGALYAGLALTDKGPRVVEFNARFGDPETQALLPRLESDLAETCMAAATGDLGGVSLQWSARPCVSVVLASTGYPGEHATGLPIAGVDNAAALEDVFVFHAGTASNSGDLVTAGGRVLSVSAVGDSFSAARDLAYEAAELIEFEGKYMRADIGARAADESSTS